MRESLIRRVLGGASLALLLLACAQPAAGYEQRNNTVSLGLQGGVGLLSGSGSYGWRDLDYYYGDFDLGPSLGIRLRYSLDRAHALGVSFEDQRFERKSGKPRDVPESYQVTTFMVDYYTYFNRPGKTCQYLVLGVGIHRDTFRISESENVIPPETFVANLGLGTEYFIRRPFALDASLRGYYLQGKGGKGFAGQLQLGFQYYVLR